MQQDTDGEGNGCLPTDRIIAQKPGHSITKSVQGRESQKQR
jgi:hypothetical protein